MHKWQYTHFSVFNMHGAILFTIIDSIQFLLLHCKMVLLSCFLHSKKCNYILLGYSKEMVDRCAKGKRICWERDAQREQAKKRFEQTGNYNSQKDWKKSNGKEYAINTQQNTKLRRLILSSCVFHTPTISSLPAHCPSSLKGKNKIACKKTGELIFHLTPETLHSKSWSRISQLQRAFLLFFLCVDKIRNGNSVIRSWIPCINKIECLFAFPFNKCSKFVRNLIGLLLSTTKKIRLQYSIQFNWIHSFQIFFSSYKIVFIRVFLSRFFKTIYRLYHATSLQIECRIKK